MSANNSLSDNNSCGERNLASQYALRVALQTMKERCISLQQRLSAVEEENLALRCRCGIDQPVENGNFTSPNKSEIESLRNEVSELNRQKFQLTEHIAMVATENRQLWSRLSQLAKDKNKQKTTNTTNETTTGQNLIRSKTFTQHSPNPNIRQKHIPVAVDDKGLDDLSLEEVSLKVLNNFNDVKIEDDKKCDGILSTEDNGLAFGFLNDDSSDGDIGLEARKCIDGLIDFKKELLKQQSDLKVALSVLKEKKVSQECPACKERRRPEMADKNLETDDLFENYKTLQTFSSTDLPSSKLKTEDLYGGSKPIDILEQKRLADEMDKMCPLCGKIYSSNVSFENFHEHVEAHFIDESDMDSSLDHKFEFISHAVGNF